MNFQLLLKAKFIKIEVKYQESKVRLASELIKRTLKTNVFEFFAH